ncbi:MAG: hypothetical protein WCS85_03655 [Candidatus Peribacteraceae bacterium]|jgi:hypothetical protein
MESPQCDPAPQYGPEEFLVLEEKVRGEQPLNSEEQYHLRLRLQQQPLLPEEEARIVRLLNPSEAEVVSLSPEECRRDYECVSHLGWNNYRIHFPAHHSNPVFALEQTLVFDRNTGLYYVKPKKFELLK